MLTPKTILVTEAEGLATALSRARFRGSIREPIDLLVQGCGADLQEAQNYQFRLDGILKKCHNVKRVCNKIHSSILKSFLRGMANCVKVTNGM